MTQTTALALPPVLDMAQAPTTFALTADEGQYLTTAAGLLRAGYPRHALLDLWNASIHNLRRRVEAYSADLFVSVVNDEAGRKRYNPNGDTLSQRWSGVDEVVLIAGAGKLALIGRKGAKTLEMINWVRNHASPAHDNDEAVDAEEVLAMAVLLQHSLFELPLPEPGHSVRDLFAPIKEELLDADKVELLADQVRSYNAQELRNCFGFLLDVLCKGTEPAAKNAKALLPTAWELATEDLRKIPGLRYHGYVVAPDSDSSDDTGAAARLRDLLVEVGGVGYIPDATRARLFRHAARLLATAKDTYYGWANEVTAARTLAQFGTAVPSLAFEEVYQEILAVWCGNRWGASGAHEHLGEFFTVLNVDSLRTVAAMFRTNDRVQAELFQAAPKARAVELLGWIREQLTIETHRAEVDAAIQHVQGQ